MTTDAVLYGVDLFGEPVRKAKAGPLAERFEFPPFSVLNAREGEWQERKRAWIAMGIKSELGRGDNPTFGDSEEITSGSLNFYRDKEKSKFGKCLETGIGAKYGREEMNATSIFDPTLCELAYKWFCPEGGASG